MLKKLTMYRLRAKVTLELREALAVAAVLTAPQPDVSSDVQVVPDPRHAGMGWRLYGSRAALMELGLPVCGRNAYETARITLGLPDGSRDAVIDKTILLENGYDKMGGVDFAKGCYVGQEVTARSKHRGTLRKYLYIVEGETTLPAPGTEITAQGKPAGALRSTCGPLGLALLRSDALPEDGAIIAGDTPAVARVPWWHETTGKGEA